MISSDSYFSFQKTHSQNHTGDESPVLSPGSVELPTFPTLTPFTLDSALLSPGSTERPAIVNPIDIALQSPKTDNLTLQSPRPDTTKHDNMGRFFGGSKPQTKIVDVLSYEFEAQAGTCYEERPLFDGRIDEAILRGKSKRVPRSREKLFHDLQPEGDYKDKLFQIKTDFSCAEARARRDQLDINRHNRFRLPPPRTEFPRTEEHPRKKGSIGSDSTSKGKSEGESTFIDPGSPLGTKDMFKRRLGVSEDRRALLGDSSSTANESPASSQQTAIAYPPIRLKKSGFFRNVHAPVYDYQSPFTNEKPESDSKKSSIKSLFKRKQSRDKLASGQIVISAPKAMNPFIFTYPQGTNTPVDSIFMASEAQRIATPPASAAPRLDYFAGGDSIRYSGAEGETSQSPPPRPRHPYLTQTSPLSGNFDTERTMFRSMVGNSGDNGRGLTDPDMATIPDHLPSSPICPRNPKHKSGGTGYCLVHGANVF